MSAREGRYDSPSGGRSATVEGEAEPALLAEIHLLRSRLQEAYATIESLRSKWNDMEDDIENLRRAASTDGLTDLWNRRFLIDSLEVSYSFAVRHRLPLSFVFMDVDHFKSFNDTFGHAAGDEVLREVAGVIRRCARDQDVVARYGGEEFAFLLPGTGRSGAIAMAERVRATLESRSWRFRPLTASFGIATLRHNELTPPCPPGVLLEHADLALYQSKREGRNRVTHADREAKAAAGMRLKGLPALDR